MKPRIVYLVDESLEHPVLQSQSLSVIRLLIDAGETVDLLVANGVSAAREEEIARPFLGKSRVVVLSKHYRGSSALASALLRNEVLERADIDRIMEGVPRLYRAPGLGLRVVASRRADKT